MFLFVETHFDFYDAACPERFWIDPEDGFLRSEPAEKLLRLGFLLDPWSFHRLHAEV